MLTMPAYLATVPGIVSESAANTGSSDADAGTFAAVAVSVLLFFLLLFMLGGVFRAVGQGLGSILDSLFAPGTLLEPRTKVPTLTKPVKSEDFFRVLPESHTAAVDDDDHFALLPADDTPQLHAPKCFVCGRPMNEDDHSHP